MKSTPFTSSGIPTRGVLVCHYGDQDRLVGRSALFRYTPLLERQRGEGWRHSRMGQGGGGISAARTPCVTWCSGLRTKWRNRIATPHHKGHRRHNPPQWGNAGPSLVHRNKMKADHAPSLCSPESAPVH